MMVPLVILRVLPERDIPLFKLRPPPLHQWIHLTTGGPQVQYSPQSYTSHVSLQIHWRCLLNHYLRQHGAKVEYLLHKDVTWRHYLDEWNVKRPVSSMPLLWPLAGRMGLVERSLINPLSSTLICRFG